MFYLKKYMYYIFQCLSAFLYSPCFGYNIKTKDRQCVATIPYVWFYDGVKFIYLYFKVAHIRSSSSIIDLVTSINK
jgi:hypothetical protein